MRAAGLPGEPRPRRDGGGEGSRHPGCCRGRLGGGREEGREWVNHACEEARDEERKMEGKKGVREGGRTSLAFLRGPDGEVDEGGGGGGG